MNTSNHPQSTPSAPALSVIGPDQGEAVVFGSIRMRILEDGTTTDNRLGLTESVIPPHMPGPPPHRHLRHDEGFYITSGTMRFTVGDTNYDATAGTLVMVPPGAAHTFANVTDQPATMLTTLTPALYVQYFRDLQDAFRDGRTPTREEQLEIMSRYATEPVAVNSPNRPS